MGTSIVEVQTFHGISKKFLLKRYK